MYLKDKVGTSGSEVGCIGHDHGLSCITRLCHVPCTAVEGARGGGKEGALCSQPLQLCGDEVLRQLHPIMAHHGGTGTPSSLNQHNKIQPLIRRRTILWPHHILAIYYVHRPPPHDVTTSMPCRQVHAPHACVLRKQHTADPPSLHINHLHSNTCAGCVAHACVGGAHTAGRQQLGAQLSRGSHHLHHHFFTIRI